MFHVKHQPFIASLDGHRDIVAKLSLDGFVGALHRGLLSSWADLTANKY
jgi:hypothetical protein